MFCALNDYKQKPPSIINIITISTQCTIKREDDFDPKLGPQWPASGGQLNEMTHFLNNQLQQLHCTNVFIIFPLN
jgi:hypothetical protein